MMRSRVGIGVRPCEFVATSSVAMDIKIIDVQCNVHVPVDFSFPEIRGTGTKGQ